MMNAKQKLLLIATATAALAGGTTTVQADTVKSANNLQETNNDVKSVTAQHDADIVKVDNEAKAKLAAYGDSAKKAHDEEVAQQAKDALAFDQKQLSDGSAQAQRDAETANYNDAVANQKAQSAQTDAQIDNTLKDGTASAQKENADQNAQADVNQNKATADAQASHDSAKAKQSATNADTENKVKAQNADSEQTASKAVSDAQYIVDHLNSTPATPGNRTAENSDIDSPAHQISTEGNLPTAISDPHIDASHQNDAQYYDYYIYSATHDTTAKINGDATSAQQKELADYAMTLINSYRQQIGQAPAIWSKEQQTAIEEAVIAREKANVGVAHTNVSPQAVKDATEKAYAAQNLGLNGENIGQSEGSQTMLEAKTNILNIITAMIYQDGDSYNGHRANFAKPNLMMAFALQQWNDGYAYIFQGASSQIDAAVTPMDTTSTAEIEAARGGNTQANRDALAQAQKALAEIQAKNAQTLKDVQMQGVVSLQGIDSNLANTLAQIKATHDAQIETNNKNAQDQIATLTAQSAKAHADNLSDLNSKLADLQKAHEAKMVTIKDITPEELALKKAVFEKTQGEALAKFEAQQVTDANIFKQNLILDTNRQKADLDNKMKDTLAKLAKNGWLTENGVTKYYENSQLAVGERKIDGHWYHFTQDGSESKGLTKLQNKTVYYDNTGKMYYGYLKQDNTYLYFDTIDGHAATGARYYNGGMEYYADDFKQLRNSYARVDNTYFYLGAYGDAVKGARYYNGGMEYYGNDYKQLRNSYARVDNTYFYLGAYGDAVKGARYYDGGMEYYGNDYKQIRNNYVRTGNTYFYMGVYGDAIKGFRHYGNNGLEYYGNDYKQYRNQSVTDQQQTVYHFNQYGDVDSINKRGAYKQVIQPNVNVWGQPGLCLGYVDSAFGVHSGLSYSARIAATKAINNGTMHYSDQLPDGVMVPVYWDLVNKADGVNYGHVAIWDGHGGFYWEGNYNNTPNHLSWSEINDVFSGRRAINGAYIGSAWHPAKLIGWSESLENQTIVRND
ncbi:SEC10/PgrA surface exclusion domain-containing protein [Leuconostoc citreum]|uniref:SEC10/PgrA surface exclusion domain-containing protein n=3 Tax=Leuconostoc citreum TaxID=33964 RepID=UPI0021A51C97|nr:SEC10/PgrA surface exclusion domain-containing protein [Leuconostoc citreum]MCT3058428.1 SEC10/PgrA surface exclusion domain-containing protein [Leuconostoc citreum]MDM7641638.1 SEC10/PgrA surface exclusion domain-containing protein [Leuconostoc citreum]MDY5162199.1 SEC10/PgrA surface exclusion domain-containing protein [Leuconostoc citreum]MDY5165769.1 SEC10/PgrA surface exclusion domain-containing protein [Leuconostoc citreum]